MEEEPNRHISSEDIVGEMKAEWMLLKNQVVIWEAEKEGEIDPKKKEGW